MTQVQVDPIDLLLTHVGHTFEDKAGCVELVRRVRDAHQRGQLTPWVTLGWTQVFRPAVFFTVDEAMAKATEVLLLGEPVQWSDVWSADLSPLAGDLGLRIVDGRVAS